MLCKIATHDPAGKTVNLNRALGLPQPETGYFHQRKCRG